MASGRLNIKLYWMFSATVMLQHASNVGAIELISKSEKIPSKTHRTRCRGIMSVAIRNGLVYSANEHGASHDNSDGAKEKREQNGNVTNASKILRNTSHKSAEALVSNGTSGDQTCRWGAYYLASPCQC